MADGERHLNAWRRARPLGIVFSAIGGALLGYLVRDVFIGVVFFSNSVAGYFMGYFVSPDLDQVGITSDEGRMMRSLSIFGVLLVMVFLPYAFIMRFVGFDKKGHRNFFSHTPWIATFIRLVWLYFPLYRVFVSYFPSVSMTIWHSISFFGQWWGLGFSDLVHWIMDFAINKKKGKQYGSKRNAVGARKKPKGNYQKGRGASTNRWGNKILH